MLVTAYLSNSEYQKFEQEATSLGMTTGELAQKIILLHLANPNEKTVFRLVKAVNDFFTIMPNAPSEVNLDVQAAIANCQRREQAAQQLKR